MTSLLRTNPKGTGAKYLYGETDMEKPRDPEPTLAYEWQSSIVWHEVRKEDEEAFRKLVETVWFDKNGLHNERRKTQTIEFALLEGIELPSERIGWKEHKVYFRIGETEYGFRKYPYIKPIKKEEETHEELWQEVKDIIINEPSVSRMDKLKQKFKITRI